VKDNVAAVVHYDLRGDDDLVWGLGAGCEGLSRILLQPISAANAYQPLAALVDLVERRATALLVTVLESPVPALAVGDAAMASADGATVLRGTGTAAAQLASESQRQFRAGAKKSIGELALPGGQVKLLVEPLRAPPHLLLAGAGPDAVPVARMTVELGWDLTVVDRRQAWARAERFPEGCRVLCVEPDALAAALPAGADAALVMTHRLTDDAAWLAALAERPPDWIGLLGPARRKARVLAELPEAARRRLNGRLRGPVGLDIGGEGAATIALSALADIHATLEGASGERLAAG
jgi:xanthine/CO dehydrogenase XdhC/CoxF family maturation factor